MQDASKVRDPSHLGPLDGHMRHQRPGHHLEPMMQSCTLPRKDTSVRSRNSEVRGHRVRQGVDTLRDATYLAPLQRLADRPRRGDLAQVCKTGTSTASLEDADHIVHGISLTDSASSGDSLSTAPTQTSRSPVRRRARRGGRRGTRDFCGSGWGPTRPRRLGRSGAGGAVRADEEGGVAGAVGADASADEFLEVG